MGTNHRAPARERRKLKCLKPFPQQGAYFDDLSDSDLQALADDIQCNGLRNPIEVLPKNTAEYPRDTIVSGHQRKRALNLNGETETVVLVRHDLAEADAATIERCFLEANQNRRHLDPLAKARVALRLFEIQRKRPRGSLSGAEEAEARDRVGKAIGMSGRNLQRYFRVLRTPVEVQDAFRAGKLPLVQAGRVADLKPKLQRAVAERLRAGDDPRAVVAEYLPSPPTRRRKATDAFVSLARNLQRGVDDLKGRVERVPRSVLRENRRLLKSARILLRKLIDRADSEPPSTPG